MARQLPIVFGQQDYLQQLGTAQGSTIALHGCYLCSFATLAKACGKDIDPVELNKRFIQNGLYVDGNLMQDDNLTKIFPDIVYQKTYSFPNAVKNADGSIASPAVPADLSLLKELVSDPTNWVIVKIHLNSAPYTHFVLCTGVNGVVSIADPMTKRIDDFSVRYGDPVANILKFVVYKGTPINTQVIDDQVRVDRDTNYNMARDIVSYLNIPVTPEDKEGMVHRAKEKIDSYINQITEYNNKVEELTVKSHDLQDNIISLKDEVAKISKEDRDYASDALEAEKKEQIANEYIHMIADKLGIHYDTTDNKKIIDTVLDKIYLLQKDSEALGLISQANPEETVKLIEETMASRQNPLAKIFLSFMGLFFKVKS